jgi:hypothetical protein
MFSERVESAIASEFHMISGCEDKQTSADVSNVGSFHLPNPSGRAGGACTSALLQVLYADKQKPKEDLSFKDVLLKMRDILKAKNFEQIPQLSSSRAMDIETKFDISPDGFKGVKRAVLIGINYIGQNGELSGCHNDVLNMKEYIMNIHGFEEENITILIDDGIHKDPTRNNILAAYKQLVADSKPGDVAYCHYSGHGGKLRDDNNDEEDGYDETLVPLDFKNAGQIRDDDLLDTLVVRMPKGVFVTAVMDCCHSGTVFDLPYNFKADGQQQSMTQNDNFDFGPFIKILSQIMSNPKIIQQASQVASSFGCCNVS